MRRIASASRLVSTAPGKGRIASAWLRSPARAIEKVSPANHPNEGEIFKKVFSRFPCFNSSCFLFSSFVIQIFTSTTKQENRKKENKKKNLNHGNPTKHDGIRNCENLGNIHDHSTPTRVRDKKEKWSAEIARFG
jgi:hypothetical protein